MEQPDYQHLIDDVRRLQATQKETITRDFYRANGRFAEQSIYMYFPTFTSLLEEAGIIPEKGTGNISETNEIEGDSWTITLPQTNISTLDQLLAHAQVDLSVWEVNRFTVNKWDSKWNSTSPMFQVKAHLTKRTQMLAIRSEIEALKQEAKKDARVPDTVHTYLPHSGNLLELTIPDLHVGKLAWGRETGGPDYDTEIAINTFTCAVNSLLERAHGYAFDRILLVLGNDLLNADDMQGRTTKGTFVTSDTRYQKTFQTVRIMLTATIEELRRIAPVDVMMVSGNHDALSTWTLGESLECYFHNYDDVVIFNEPTYHKYYRWGDVLILFTHGDKGKRADFPLLLATDRPKDFGETRFREVHTGHLHQTKTEEFHGVRVRILPSLSPEDAWHSENGFKGQQREAVAFAWNDKQGLLAQFVYNADV